MKPDVFVLQYPILTAETRFRRMHPEGLYRVHTRNWTLILSVEGGAVANRAEDRFTVEAGDALLCPPDVLLDCRLEGRDNWVHRWVAFHPRARLDALLQWPAAGGGLRLLRVRGEELWDRVLRCWAELHQAVHRSTPPRGLDLCFNILEKMLLWLEAANPRVHPPAQDPRILGVTQYMAANYHRKLTVPHLAARCNLSPSRFAHLFREVTGTSPMKYLEAIRMEHVERLLLSTDDTLASIAAACGYCNEFYLGKVFKRRYGESPGRFRNAGRSEES